LLLGCENDGIAADEINALFRAAHPFKGSAGLFGLDYIVDFVFGTDNEYRYDLNSHLEPSEGQARTPAT
jgi:chemotaxis protein histidine kinase CheA